MEKLALSAVDARPFSCLPGAGRRAYLDDRRGLYKGLGRTFGRARYAADQPPVTLMWRARAGRLWRRSIMKSWPRGLRVIASSIAASTRALLSEARSGARRSAASSWPRHI